jgi:hypothetical protein
MLYTEDTYEVKNYPYFGYFRGKFTANEIRSLDSYAAMFGIELVPCIQTLAHLNGAFKWDCFKEINDCGDILLIGDEKTYKFLEEAIASVSKMFTSRNINIGMDEAEMVGLGKYLQKNGYRPRFDLMMTHLRRVIAICHKYGLKPTMWSDMFFKLLSMNYYDDAKIDRNVVEKVPSDVTLCYWDYYKTDKAIYDRNIEKHKNFKNNISFAGGAWKWMGLAPCNLFSLETSEPALQSCYEHGISDVTVTGWGDNGGECSSFATLPVLAFYAEFCYGENTDKRSLKKRLKTCAKANFDDFMNLDLVNLPNTKGKIVFPTNPSKYLLYQDILCGLFDSCVEIGKYNEQFKKNVSMNKRAAKRNPEWSYIFETNGALNSLLSKKCDIGLKIKKAYDDKDRETLREIASVELLKILKDTEKLHFALRQQWYSENKTFGFDVIDIRFGTLKERIASARLRITDYLEGKTEKLDELEEKRLPFTNRSFENSDQIDENFWTDIVSVNTI